MAHVWMKDADGSWVSTALEHPAYSIGFRSSIARLKRRPKQSAAWPALLSLPGERGREDWALVSPTGPDVKINGAQMQLGVRVLQDRDAIQVNGTGLAFFSTESLAEAVPFPGSPEPVPCPRCRMAIETACPAVRCPNCGIWHHQNDDGLPCWTYAERCSLCDQLTDPDAGYRWTPEDL